MVSFHVLVGMDTKARLLRLHSSIRKEDPETVRCAWGHPYISPLLSVTCSPMTLNFASKAHLGLIHCLRPSEGTPTGRVIRHASSKKEQFHPWYLTEMVSASLQENINHQGGSPRVAGGSILTTFASDPLKRVVLVDWYNHYWLYLNNH
jgi:hypothetical protein